MTRDEHLAWAKARALEELDGRYDAIARALGSLTSDLAKHEELAGHESTMLLHEMAVYGVLQAEDDVRAVLEAVR